MLVVEFPFSIGQTRIFASLGATTTGRSTEKKVPRLAIGAASHHGEDPAGAASRDGAFGGVFLGFNQRKMMEIPIEYAINGPKKMWKFPTKPIKPWFLRGCLI